MIDPRKSRLTAVMTLMVSLLALFASLVGVFDPRLYHQALLAGSMSKFLVHGSVVQDLASILFGSALLLLSILNLRSLRKRRMPQPKPFIASLGLAAYFFYGYGLYVIQGGYTALYLVYMAIFGLSLYSLILGLTAFDLGKPFRLPGWTRKAIAGFLLTILLVLVPVWLLRMAPDLARHVPGEVYGVFVLDLCVVFPALGIVAGKLLRKEAFGNVLAGVALVKTMTLCFSVALGEWLNLDPRFGFRPQVDMIAIFTGLTVVSLVLSFGYFRHLQPEPHP